MVRTDGISVDELNQRIFQAKELLKPIGIEILSDVYRAELESRPKGLFIKYLDIRLVFSQPHVRTEDLEDKTK